MKLGILALVILTFTFTSCNNSSDEQEGESTSISYVDDGDFDVQIAIIEAELAEQVLVKSLMYLHDDGSTASTYAYLDKEDKLIKIEEVLFDVNTNSFIYQDFYFKAGKQFASRLRKQKSLGEKTFFSEVVSFYDEKGAVTASKERAAQFEEYLGMEGYKACENQKHDSENAYAMLYQKGKYQTAFRGFASAGNYEFLIVGGNDENDFTSSLSIQEDSPTLRFLRAEGKKALGQKLKVEFERFTDQQGYEMQLLRDLAIVKGE